MAALRRHALRSIWLFLACSLISSVRAGGDEAAGTPLYALVVGGGPDVESNAAQIEGHVRFVAGLLPTSSKHVVLFADGRTDQSSVSYAETGAAADAQRALAILLADHDAEESVMTRPPEFPVPLNGPARLRDVHRAFRHALGSGGEAARAALALLRGAWHPGRKERDEHSLRSLG